MEIRELLTSTPVRPAALIQPGAATSNGRGPAGPLPRGRRTQFSGRFRVVSVRRRTLARAVTPRGLKKDLIAMMGALALGSLGRAAEMTAVTAELVRTEREFFESAFSRGFGEAVRAYIAEDGFLANSLTLGRAAQSDRARATKRERDVIRWRPLHADVAASGDLGFTWGVAESAPAKEGPFKPYGIYVTIWRRQTDGTWKFVYDSATILSAERLDAFLREHFPKSAELASPVVPSNG